MARRVRADERIAQYAAKIDGKLRADEKSTTSMKVFTSSYLGQVLEECGYKKRGTQNLHRIQDALARANVHPDPPLTTPDLPWKQQIHFTRTPASQDHDVRRVRFPAERALEEFLEANFKLLFPGLRLVKRQYQVQSGKLDMLARDRDGYVVIELKRTRPGDRLLNQLLRYMDDVSKEDRAKGGTGSVRGLVISSELDLPMHGRLAAIAAEKGRRIDWWRYRVDFEMEPAPAALPWSEPIDAGEPWTAAGVVNPDSPARFGAMDPYDHEATMRAMGLR